MLKIVVIDGNAISRRLLTTVLTDGGHEVIADLNAGPAALAQAIRLQPQVVCIDIGQTDEDGLQRLDAIREALPKTLIFMVSGSFDSGAVQTGIARGVHGFIVKPFNGMTVLATIRNAVIKLARQHRTA